MTKYFIKAPKSILTDKTFDLKSRVYLFIIDFESNGKSCFASLQRIAQELNESKRNVIRSLNELEKNGLIVIERHTEKGHNPYNVYKINDLSAKSVSQDEIKQGYKKTIRAQKTSQKGYFKREKPVPEWLKAYEDKDFEIKRSEQGEEHVELTEAAKRLFNHSTEDKEAISWSIQKTLFL